MTTETAIYVGSVTHRRHAPKPHRFRYSAFWMLVDLAELDALSDRLKLFSYNRGNVFSLYDRDHGDGSTTSLRLQAEWHLARAGIDCAGGSIQLFCMPRMLGYDFNPLSVYFCRTRDGALAALIYEVHNTFGERHSYLIPAVRRDGAVRQRCDKAFYVSPFMDMDLRYEFRISRPGGNIAIGIRALAESGPILTAALTGRRAAFDDRVLTRLLATMPAISLKTVAAIHWEALRLWLKGLRLRDRPQPPLPITLVSATSEPSP